VSYCIIFLIQYENKYMVYIQQFFFIKKKKKDLKIPQNSRYVNSKQSGIYIGFFIFSFIYYTIKYRFFF
jgi:hypothetical protein